VNHVMRRRKPKMMSKAVFIFMLLSVQALPQIVKSADDLAPDLALQHGQPCIITVANGQSTAFVISETRFLIRPVGFGPNYMTRAETPIQ
jgi:hypothetical protein